MCHKNATFVCRIKELPCHYHEYQRFACSFTGWVAQTGSCQILIPFCSQHHHCHRLGARTIWHQDRKRGQIGTKKANGKFGTKISEGVQSSNILREGVKHCERHNGPEGWVHITRSQFTVHKSWTYFNFRISIEYQIQNLNQNQHLD